MGNFEILMTTTNLCIRVASSLIVLLRVSPVLIGFFGLGFIWISILSKKNIEDREKRSPFECGWTCWICAAITVIVTRWCVTSVTAPRF
jgi:NADH:ubiquinone oxidoreductase subunit 3 (subunit A)